MTSHTQWHPALEEPKYLPTACEATVESQAKLGTIMR